MTANQLNYHYDDLFNESSAEEAFDPPMDQLAPEDYSRSSRVLDSPADSTDISGQTQPLNEPLSNVVVVKQDQGQDQDLVAQPSQGTGLWTEGDRSSTSKPPPVALPPLESKSTSRTSLRAERRLEQRTEREREPTFKGELQVDREGENEGESRMSEEATYTRKQRIREKVSKTKARMPEKKKLIKKDNETSKREQLLVRNRLSAQRSRERKQQELEQLRSQNAQLLAEKADLQSQLAATNGDLNLLLKAIATLPSETQAHLATIQAEMKGTTQETRPGRQRGLLRNPVFLATAFIGCLCIVACLTPLFWDSARVVGVPSVPSRLLVSQKTEGYSYKHTEAYSLDELQ